MRDGTGFDGLEVIDEFVKSGNATQVRWGGHPSLYSMTAE
jgi:hypothetical protein